MVRRSRPAIGALSLSAWVLPGAAQAHVMAERYDLPLPLSFYLGGAGAVVALSFVLAAALRRGAGAGLRERHIQLPAPLRGLAMGIRIAAIAIFLLLIAAGIFGNQDDWDTNILPVAVWVIGWVGIAFISALLGDVWPLLDPWVNIARLCGTKAARRKTSIPDWVGVWPGCLLFSVVAWAEIVWPSNAVPARLALALVLYSAIAWAGMALWGAEEWRRRGDALALFFGLFARFAPIAVESGAGGRAAIVLRPYGAGLLTKETPAVSMMVFIILVLAAVGFDGISETPFWHGIADDAMTRLYDFGLVTLIGNVAAASLVKTLGLLATPILFFAVYLACSAMMAWIAGGATMATARRFAPTLVPIAIAYHLAHYLSYLAIQGQAIIPLISDPLGFGWDVFGTRAYQPDPDILRARSMWIAAVTAILLGHVAAVFLGHATAIGFYRDRRIALRGQVPIMVLMVGYTMLSLWILAQPIVAL